MSIGPQKTGQRWVPTVLAMNILLFNHKNRHFSRWFFRMRRTLRCSTRRPQYVRRSSGEGLRDAHRTIRLGFIPKVLIWGCFNERGLGSFRLLTTTMNSTRHVETLENALIPSANIWFGDSTDFVFQQDNAPCHKSRDTRKFFEENQMTVMNWPPLQPRCKSHWKPLGHFKVKMEANIIQHSWSSVKRSPSGVEWWSQFEFPLFCFVSFHGQASGWLYPLERWSY